ncbi:MAG: NosD domain-containing protein [Candidatus Heimdallarchaeota archaeon]
MSQEKKLNKRRLIISISIAVVIIASAITSILVYYYYEPPNQEGVSLSYIDITQDSDFTVKYNFPGSGTVLTPYIIENYQLNYSDGTAISIKDTTKNFIIRNCTLHNCQTGIVIMNVAPSTANITNSTFIQNEYGLVILSSDYANITQSIFHNNINGIYLADVDGVIFSENVCSGIQSNAFRAEYSNLGHFNNNEFTDENSAEIEFCYNWQIRENLDVSFTFGYGSFHQYYDNVFMNNGNVSVSCDLFYIANNNFNGELNVVQFNTIDSLLCVGNNFTNGGFDFTTDIRDSDYSPFLFEGNYVDNKPAIVFMNQENVSIDNSTFGQIFCFNCTNVDISSGNYANAVSAIFCYDSENVTITNNQIRWDTTVFDNTNGIITYNCANMTLVNNTITNYGRGLASTFAGDVLIEENSFSENIIGISIYIYYDLIIQDNNITNNDEGIRIYDLAYSDPCVLLRNNCSFNNDIGIMLEHVEEAEIRDNVITNNYIGLMLNVERGNVSENEINDNYGIGIYLYQSEDCFIFENTMNGNGLGIFLNSAYYSTIFWNEIINSTDYGIHMNGVSNYNDVYSNNFINNSLLYPSHSQAYDDGLLKHMTMG